MARNLQLPVQRGLWQPHETITIDPLVCEEARRAIIPISRAKTYDRHGIYSLKTIFDRISLQSAGSREEKWDMDGVTVKTQLGRFIAFRNSQKCACCGIEGTFFLLERHIHENTLAGYSLVLYAITKDEELVALTADHILPDSMGGRYSSVNFQTMCKPCNQEKAHLMAQYEIDQIRANPTAFAKEWVNISLLDAILDLREECLYASDADYVHLHALFERTRKALAFGTYPSKQQDAIDDIYDALEPVVVPPVKWHVRLWQFIRSLRVRTV